MRWIALSIVVILIVGLIWYLEEPQPEPITATVPTMANNSEMVVAEGPIAPEFAGIEAWLNTDPLTMQELRGKTVLIDFWTYSCINCIRTLPYLTAWDEAYRDDGLVIVGVHAPEFWFEKDVENVQKALDEHGIEYPIAIDNDKQTWRAYGNRHWPHKYLIDKDGIIKYDHIGEGNYQETERWIKMLLNETSETFATENATTPDFGKIMTPELYFGDEFSRGQQGNPKPRLPGQEITYEYPASMQPSRYYLVGTWAHGDEYVEAVENATILLQYNAKDVNIVAGEQGIIDATIDNKQKTITVEDFTLYPIDSSSYKIHNLTLNVSPGVKIYTFTFG